MRTRHGHYDVLAELTFVVQVHNARAVTKLFDVNAINSDAGYVCTCCET